MKNPFVYTKNAIRVLGLKLRYGKRIRIGWIQSFDKIKIQISKKGSFESGSYNQGRGSMYIGVFDNGKLKIGDHCFFNINSSITCLDKIEIGNNCKFGNNLVIVDHDHNYKSKKTVSSETPEFILSPIRIGDDVWCGANVVILRGTEIGDGCVIAAGSVVKGTIEPNTLFVKGEKRIIS